MPDSNEKDYFSRTIFSKKKRKIFEDYLVEMVYRMKSMRTAAEILAK